MRWCNMIAKAMHHLTHRTFANRAHIFLYLIAFLLVRFPTVIMKKKGNKQRYMKNCVSFPKIGTQMKRFERKRSLKQNEENLNHFFFFFNFHTNSGAEGKCITHWFYLKPCSRRFIRSGWRGYDSDNVLELWRVMCMKKRWQQIELKMAHSFTGDPMYRW